MKALLLPLLALALASFKAPAPVRAWHIEGFAQGTTFRITYYSKDSLVTKREICDILNGIDSSLSIYKPYSLISKFNASHRGVKTDRHLEMVVQKSLEVYQSTGQLFDITVKPLVDAWGFGPAPATVLPDSAKISAALACVGSGNLALKKDSLIKALPCLQIDVNGIAQGYTVDILSNFLSKLGLYNHMVELGGEIRISGSNPLSKQPMRVGIEVPSENEFEQLPVKRILSFSSGAVTTSGNYRKYYESKGRKVSHLVNPKTGFSVNTDLISVTVWAADAITADAFDNALIAMGMKDAMAFAENSNEIEAYFIYRTADGTPAEATTKGFKRFLYNN